MSRQYLTSTTNAVRALGLQLAVARRRHRRTATEVAERAGTTRVTLRRIERGDPAVSIGLYFEVATVLAVPLFGREGRALAELVAQGERDLALLPSRVDMSEPGDVLDDF